MKRAKELKESFSLEIAGYGIEFRLSDPSFLSLLKDRYSAFLSLLPSDFSFDIIFTPHLNSVNHQDEKPLVEIEKKGEYYYFRRLDNPFVASFDNVSGMGKVTLADNIYCFDSFLRIFYSLILSEKSGFLLHGAGIQRGNEGYVFFGPSGSGKSTIARLSKKHLILSDELVIIHKNNSDFVVHGTPFWGDFERCGQKSCAKLSHLYFLKKAKINKTTALSPSRAIREILACIFSFPGKNLNRENMLNFCYSLIENTPVEELYFKEDESFWKYIDENGRNQFEKKDSHPKKKLCL